VFNGPVRGHDDAVQRFAAAAERYCDLIESDWRPRRETLFTELAGALADLYIAALALPDAVNDSDDLPDDRLTHEAWRTAFFPFAEALSANDFYYTVSPFKESRRKPKALGGSLSDDLGDIYRDVKEGLLLRDDGFSADAVWHWRFNFWSHWGAHAVDALRIIHLRLADAGGGPYDLTK
jgi:uncharacterized protein DUF5063